MIIVITNNVYKKVHIDSKGNDIGAPPSNLRNAQAEPGRVTDQNY